jgi:hypothetical protein
MVADRRLNETVRIEPYSARKPIPEVSAQKPSVVNRQVDADKM